MREKREVQQRGSNARVVQQGRLSGGGEVRGPTLRFELGGNLQTMAASRSKALDGNMDRIGYHRESVREVGRERDLQLKPT